MVQGLERKLGWAVVVALLLFAAAHAMVRGPVSIKGHANLCDFASPWASSRLWLTGQNPYDNSLLWDTWIKSRGAFDTEHSFWLALMPPGAYAALSPIGALPAGPAAGAWLIISAVSVFVILATTLSLARIPIQSLTAWLFIAGALAMAPVQTVVAVGQLSLPVIALLFAAMWLARDNRDLLAGIALGVAGAIKPQLVAPFFLYYLFVGKWRVFWPAIAAAIVLTVIGVLPLQLRGIPWYSQWSQNIGIGAGAFGPNDPTPTGPWRHQMIDLRLWLFTLLENREAVVAATLGISLVLAILYIVLLSRVRHLQDQLLPLAALASLTLLPIYHRAYDATLLVLALAWALRSWPDRRYRTVATLALVAVAVFYIPFDFLVLLMKRTTALDGLAETWIWRVFIFPHYAVATLATGLIMLGAMFRYVQIAEDRPQAVHAGQPAELESLVPSKA